jgi:hypothetical protein
MRATPVGLAFGPNRMLLTRTGPALGCKVMIEFHLSVDALGKTRFAYWRRLLAACACWVRADTRT